MLKNVEDAINKIVSERKNPMLVLSVKEIRHGLDIKIEQALKGKKFKKLDVLLQTAGGDIDAAFKAIRLIRRSSDELNIIVPLYAKSAGTLMCLAADNIIMGDLSELGPLDTQIPERQDGEQEYKSALNESQSLEEVRRHNFEVFDMCTQLLLVRCSMRISEAVQHAATFTGKTSGVLYERLEPRKIGEYQRALNIGRQYGKQILVRYMGYGEDKATDIIDKLVQAYPTHSYVLDVDELQELGLPAIAASDSIYENIKKIRLMIIGDDNIKLIEKGGIRKKLSKQ